MTEFSIAVRRARRESDMLQFELAKAVGKTEGWMSKIENARLPPPDSDTISLLALALGMEPSALMDIASRTRSVEDDMSDADEELIEWKREYLSSRNRFEINDCAKAIAAICQEAGYMVMHPRYEQWRVVVSKPHDCIALQFIVCDDGDILTGGIKVNECHQEGSQTADARSLASELFDVLRGKLPKGANLR